MGFMRRFLGEKCLLVLFSSLWFGITTQSASSGVPFRHLSSFRCGTDPTGLKLSPRLQLGVDLRGGSKEGDEYDADEDEEDEYDDDDSDDASVEISTGSDTVFKLFKGVVKLAGKLTVSTLKVTSRVVLAAFESGDDGEEEDTSVATSIVKSLKRMWKAAWNPDAASADTGKEDRVAEDEDDASEEATKKRPKKKEKTETRVERKPDFGRFLSSSYGIEGTRDDLDSVPLVLGGTISDALREARSQARLLVVLIPSSRPGKGGKNSVDEEAIRGFLSAEVSSVAEKRARKSGDTGSYVLWGAKAGSAEAVAAIKRLKAKQTNSKGQKRPVLLVAYPSQVIDRGVPKVVPRLLAQHHCSPPPSPEMMAAWLNALRKRHAKQFASMQAERREEQLYKERRDGYQDSVQSDRDRERRERIEEEERQEKEQAERERIEQLERRREALRSSLPDEPDSSVTGTKTIALRMADGRSTQRRFAPDTPVATLFNLVDVSFEMERETVILTTLNGQKTLTWEEDNEATLAEVGFGRMTGLRVSIQKEEDETSS